jgi:hypothetical protein
MGLVLKKKKRKEIYSMTLVKEDSIQGHLCGYRDHRVMQWGERLGPTLNTACASENS